MDLSPVDRSLILLEINTHIEDSLAKFPEQGLKQILEDLGDASKVANHYRLNKGLGLFKPDRHPIIKWLSITFITTFSLFLLFIAILVWKFTPVFELDEKKGKIVLLGGLVDINSTSGKVKIMDQYHFAENNYSNQFDGAIDFPKEETDELVVNFKTGLFNFTNSIDGKLSWNCKLDTPPTDDFINISSESVEMDLERFEGANCDIKVPINTKLTVDGKSATINITDGEFDTFIEIDNGLIKFSPNPEVDYSYDLKVTKGTIDEFNSIEGPDAYEVKIFIENGMIKK
jgi:hypothetical protein